MDFNELKCSSGFVVVIMFIEHHPLVFASVIEKNSTESPNRSISFAEINSLYIHHICSIFNFKKSSSIELMINIYAIEQNRSSASATHSFEFVYRSFASNLFIYAYIHTMYVSIFLSFIAFETFYIHDSPWRWWNTFSQTDRSRSMFVG